MNDNLPEINFKEKKEKKGGLLGWLKGKMPGNAGGAMGQAGLSPTAMNVGRALGTAKFGASSGGIMGLLAGKVGTIALVATVAVAGGLYISNNAPAPAPSTGAFSSNRAASNYVPAILRSQAANSGSSLDMFKETNKSAGLAMEAGPAAAKKGGDEKAPVDEAATQDPAQPGPEGMAQDMMGKLQGGSMGSLTSQIGGNSGKISAGGFGNKFNQGATGAKTGFTSGIGSGFAGSPKFDARKNKMMAMKGVARPVVSAGKAGKGKFGAGSFGQAKGLKALQQSYSGSSADSARSTQDKAWEGSTAGGDAEGAGAGLSDGGAGIVTSPSMDNAGSGGGGGEAADPVVTDPTGKEDVSPWASLVTTIMTLVLISAILSFIASKLCTAVITYVLGCVIAAVAAILGVIALVMSIQLMTQYGQNLMGTLYGIGSALAIAAAAMAYFGASDGVMGAGPATSMMWLAAGAGVIGLMGSMLGGK